MEITNDFHMDLWQLQEHSPSKNKFAKFKTILLNTTLLGQFARFATK